MKKLNVLILVFWLWSCNEKLLEKPDNLIEKEKMVQILTDVAIVNAAKITNVSILRDNNIDPMAYVFERHGIDSLQFVESDRYYASLPAEYEEIYLKVEAVLEGRQKEFEDAKAKKDSLMRLEAERKQKAAKKLKDSLR
ncbi:DUF4296 domain-containing protein [Pseudozobellia thermophila]|uniref:DUF4296 domain-containing protein n=1 Tax=Pseudozobellia thermophila TaxID=192903 RepID=A0A1M6AGR9_9FLAO|nr:DUF4296 domain-containing protein [Pseudozobellia thermophila]SHI35675.1 protein of unknown function [Pseudozobellia thermophila]